MPVAPTLPADLDAEEATLGACLLSAAAIIEANELVSAEDFYKPSHAHIFTAILACEADGTSADVVTVHAKLIALGLAEGIKASDLVSLTANVPAISSVRHYAGIVAEAGRKRRLAGVGDELRSEALDPTRPAVAVVEALESRLAAAVGERQSENGPRSVGDVLDRVLFRAADAQVAGGVVGGVRTGHADLDRLLGAFEPGNLVIVGAATSMGKTAFALDLVTHAAAAGTPTLVFSAEMSALEIGRRLLASAAKVATDRQLSGDLTEAEWARLTGEAQRLGALPLAIDDKGGPSVVYMRRTAKAAQSRGGLGLVIVDYLQLMAGPDRAENRHRELSAITAGLKGLAKDLGVVLVLLSQLNREPTKRADKRPMLADLRESGTIEEAADVVLFLYRDEVYNPDSADRGLAEIIVGKNRNGPVGMVKLVWLGPFVAFGDHAWQERRL